MATKRPTSITVFAILNLVMGGMGLFCNLCGVANLALAPMLQQFQEKMQAQQGARAQGPDMQQMQKELEARLPMMQTVQIIQIGVAFVLNTILVIAGIALMRMKPAGRWASICYSIGRIIFSIGVLIYTIGYVGPAMDDWFQEQQKQRPEAQVPSGLFSVMAIGGGIVAVIIPVTYAVILLIFMSLPSTGRALAAAGIPSLQTPEEDYYDSDYQRERRQPPPES
jgi:hypothetical protein